MDVQRSTPTEGSMKLLSLMAFSKMRLGRKYSIITNYSRISLILSIVVNTSGHVYDDDFVRLFFLHVHREASALAGELTVFTKSDRFRFLCTAYLSNLMGSVCLILSKDSTMRVTIPLDLSTVFHTSTSLLSLSSYPTSSYSFPNLVSSTLCLRHMMFIFKASPSLSYYQLLFIMNQ